MTEMQLLRAVAEARVAHRRFLRTRRIEHGTCARSALYVLLSAGHGPLADAIQFESPDWPSTTQRLRRELARTLRTRHGRN